jgi:tetratricopeptide (TPR) repeat protein
LYFIYQDLKADTVQADSLKEILINKYPASPYGLKLRGIIQKKKTSVSEEETIFKKRYLKAEDLLDKRHYKAAITEFNKIAQQDSGSVWAQKARYAAAYSYEHFLKNIPLAIEAYKRLIKEYPNCQFILAHCGRCFISPNMKDALEGLPIAENLWIDTSAVCDTGVFLELFSRCDISRILFGTDLVYKGQPKTIHEVLDSSGVDIAVLEKIYYLNAKKVLGL